VPYLLIVGTSQAQSARSLKGVFYFGLEVRRKVMIMEITVVIYNDTGHEKETLKMSLEDVDKYIELVKKYGIEYDGESYIFSSAKVCGDCVYITVEE